MKNEALIRGAEVAPISGTFGTLSGMGVVSMRTLSSNLVPPFSSCLTSSADRLPSFTSRHSDEPLVLELERSMERPTFRSRDMCEQVSVRFVASRIAGWLKFRKTNSHVMVLSHVSIHSPPLKTLLSVDLVH